MRPVLALTLTGAGVVALTFAAGWLSAGSPSTPDAGPAPARPIRPVQGGSAADPVQAVADLAFFIADDRAPAPEAAATTPEAAGGDPVIDYGGDPPPVVPASAPPPRPPAPPPPPPPPPDVSVVFRRQLVAVVSDPDGQLSVMVSGPQGRRRLRVGDLFQDGWRLESLTRDAVVLGDGERTRRIPFFGGAVTSEG